jgi:aryl-phospho-beta-D-glucosidase BglC (GH1 family)
VRRAGRSSIVLMGACLGILPLMSWTASPCPAAEEPAADWWHTEDRWVKDSRGRVQKLYGVNAVVLLKNERAKFETASKHGFNIVRLMLFKNDLEKPVKDFPDQDRSGLEAIDRAVKWCREFGIRLILDHQIWGKDIEPAPADFLTNAKTQAEWLAMWRLLVDRYKQDSTVVGIDLMNEPYGLKHKMKLPASVADPQGAWEDVAKNAIKELRAVNPKLLFVVEDFGRTNAPNGLWRDVKFLKENNCVYSSHLYYSGHKQWNPWGKAYAAG